MGNRITLGNDNSKNLEYSINNGIDFLDIPINPYWGEGFSGNLFSEKIIIRTKDTKEIIYKTPNISEISEKYTYENGKTNVTFSLNGNASNQVKYKYYIKDEELSGNNIDVKNDVSIKLMASDIKDFVTQTKEKEINVKVIKTEKPSIKVNEENELILDEGIITNDKLGNIYYSIDGGEFNINIYANKVKLSSGTHTIKAYQITSENKVKSDIETVNVTIEEKKPEDNNQTDKDEENNKEENEQINKDENTNNANNKNDGTDNEQKNVLKSENKNIPKTGDAISIYAVAIFVIITLNLVVRKKRKK